MITVAVSLLARVTPLNIASFDAKSQALFMRLETILTEAGLDVDAAIQAVLASGVLNIDVVDSACLPELLAAIRQARLGTSLPG